MGRIAEADTRVLHLVAELLLILHLALLEHGIRLGLGGGFFRLGLDEGVFRLGIDGEFER